MFQTKVVEKIKTHIFCSVTFSPKMLKQSGRWEDVLDTAYMDA